MYEIKSFFIAFALKKLLSKFFVAHEARYSTEEFYMKSRIILWSDKQKYDSHIFFVDGLEIYTLLLYSKTFTKGTQT